MPTAKRAVKTTTVRTLPKKLEDFAFPQVGLDIFALFAGDKNLTTQEAESEALNIIKKSLAAYNDNIFAMRVDMTTGDIVWQNGMTNVLGRTDITRYDQFENCVHPNYIAGYNLWSTCLFESMVGRNLDYTDLAFHIRVPFKNEVTQLYAWYNQHSIALISDTGGSILSFLSIYTFDSAWHKGNPSIMMAYVSEKNQLSDLDKVMKAAAGQKILQQEFTEMERHILNCYAENIKPQHRYKTMKRNTIYDHNKNILSKAQTLFNYNFISAEVFALFLKDNNLWQKEENV
jgi:hypothetical protein